MTKARFFEAILWKMQIMKQTCVPIHLSVDFLIVVFVVVDVTIEDDNTREKTKDLLTNSNEVKLSLNMRLTDLYLLFIQRNINMRKICATRKYFTFVYVYDYDQQ